MGISEKKMQIVIDNYFKQECDVNTSIRKAFEKGFRIGVKKASSAQPSVSKEEMVGDTISRQAAIKAICEDGTMLERQGKYTMTMAERKQKDADILDTLPSAQHTALTADDIETIRIHLSAFKEELGNQGRWTEAAEYERLIQRLIGKGGHDGKC